MSVGQRTLVAIPMYNEADAIADVLADVRAHAAEAAVLVVADGSTDGGPDVVDALGVRQIRLPCNLGYTRALQTAMRYALREGYTCLVTLDGDGQHPAADIPRLVEALERDGVDVAIGSRFTDRTRPDARPWTRRVGTAAFAWVTTLTLGVPIRDTTSGFRAYRATTLPRLLPDHFVDLHAEALIFLGKLGYRIVEVPVTMRERQTGRSMYTRVANVSYPLATALLIGITLLSAWLTRRTGDA